MSHALASPASGQVAPAARWIPSPSLNLLLLEPGEKPTCPPETQLRPQGSHKQLPCPHSAFMGHLPSRAPAGRHAAASPPWAAWTRAGGGCLPGPQCPDRERRPRCPEAGWNLQTVRAGGRGGVGEYRRPRPHPGCGGHSPVWSRLSSSQRLVPW